MADLQYEVTWRVYPHQDLVQMSGLLCGLVALQRAGVISLAVERHPVPIGINVPLTDLRVMQKSTGRSCRAIWEFRDQSDVLYAEQLAGADWYFKRQFTEQSLRVAGTANAHKVRPLGLTIAAFSWPAWRCVAAAIRTSLGSATARRARGGAWRALRKARSDFMLWATLPDTASVEVGDEHPREPAIVFQPRLWNAESQGSGDVFDVANADRIHSVQVLRAAFGQPERIGLIHTADAVALAPDLMLQPKVSVRRYHRQLKSSLIAVNCIGLSGSVGWKFAEYLAAGVAVVSQPIDKILLAPINPDEHYLVYESIEQAVELCRRLLKERHLASAMSRRNRLYYQTWVHPPAHALHLLKSCFERG
ncbi:MAG: glycosyltransferase [Steroidobacteraceae bacterium]